VWHSPSLPEEPRDDVELNQEYKDLGFATEYKSNLDPSKPAKTDGSGDHEVHIFGNPNASIENTTVVYQVEEMGLQPQLANIYLPRTLNAVSKWAGNRNVGVEIIGTSGSASPMKKPGSVSEVTSMLYMGTEQVMVNGVHKYRGVVYTRSPSRPSEKIYYYQSPYTTMDPQKIDQNDPKSYQKEAARVQGLVENELRDQFNKKTWRELVLKTALPKDIQGRSVDGPDFISLIRASKRVWSLSGNFFFSETEKHSVYDLFKEKDQIIDEENAHGRIETVNMEDGLFPWQMKLNTHHSTGEAAYVRLISLHRVNCDRHEIDPRIGRGSPRSRLPLTGPRRVVHSEC